MPTRAVNRMFGESSSSSGSGGCREAPVLCAPRPRRAHVHPCSADLILGPPPFLLASNNTSRNKHKEGNAKDNEAEIDGGGGWALFGGSPPARADNPLVHDPNFLRRHAVPDSPSQLRIFDHLSRDASYSQYRPTYISSSSSSNSFAPSSFAPAVRVQGFDVGTYRGSSHGNNGGGRVLSARA